MIAMQSENKSQQFSRSPSPIPSSISNEFTLHKNNSSPKLTVSQQQSIKQRRSSFSNTYEDKNQYLHPNYQQKQRNESDISFNDEEEGTTAYSVDSISVLPTNRFASDKSNNEFHTLFRSIPENERLIDDYGCALQKEILLQGRVYITEHHLCFNANIFGWITNLVIAFKDIEDIEKKTTAIIIPNAILITTATSKHFLASFLSRDQAYDLMTELWRASRNNNHSTIEENGSKISNKEDDDDSTLSDSSYSEEEDDDIATLQNPTRQGSLASLPVPKHVQVNEINRRRAMSEVAQLPNNVQNPNAEQVNEKTECDCNKTEQHFPTVVMDNTYNTTVEKMYNLLYNSTFMDNFLCQVEKSTDVCIGDWCKAESCVYSRESSYIKYLGGSIGPKSTKCLLKEEILHFDINNYISQLTITQTPDVPSGSSFNVKTKTCITWAGKGQVRVLVTVLVDFVKSSWLKSTIEKASIDGQQNYYKNLDVAIRKYLTEDAKPTLKQHKRKRRHKRAISSHQQQQQQQLQSIEQPNNKNNDLIQVLSSITVSQLIAICMTMMVLSNIYIAMKMSGVNRQLNQLAINKNWDSSYHQPYQYQYQHTNNDESSIADNQLELYKLAKFKLDKKMLELEKMISKTNNNMNHLSNIMQHQKHKILTSNH